VDLVKFYRGEAPDNRGRMLQEIWGWDKDRLEAQHDYIQMLFPLKEPSQFNLHAPLLDDATAERFRSDKVIQANLLRSFQVMLRFYGFRIDENTGEVVESESFAERAVEWLHPGDHNHLRITRILKCLKRCSLRNEAAEFLQRLEAVADPNHVSPASLRYWRDAVGVGE
jgi:hypothetical protein